MTKQQFFFNPKNPKKSFDVYIDKNPKDTIPIKYKTIDDVKNTIKKLERLYIENHHKSGLKTLNATIPNRTKKEWMKDNPDKININLEQSILRNREKANAYRKEHYHKNRE